MNDRIAPGGTHHSRCIGFSLIELVISLAVLLVFTAVAVPMALHAVRSYQLSSTSSQLAQLLKLTRFEAIRKNALISCRIAQNGNNWILWIDSDGDAQLGPTETRFILSGSETLLPQGSVPDPSAITSALGAAAPALSVPYSGGGANAVSYDSRGVINFNGAAPAVFALYLGDSSDVTAGYRAAIVLPSGAVQLWTASSGGSWQRIS